LVSAELIILKGLSPDEEVDYAYLVVNNGLDVFFEAN
jgi:hypothetical protein